MDRWNGSEAVDRLVESGCIPVDPLPWILGSDEPFAVWHALTAVLGLPADDLRVVEAHDAVLGSAMVQTLAEQITSHPRVKLERHDDPLYLPGRLRLLADFGLRRGDIPALDATLADLLEQQDRVGRFSGPMADRPKPPGASRLCDTVPVTEVLVRFGFDSDTRVSRAISLVVGSHQQATNGRGWACAPERGPVPFMGTRRVICPQLDIEALRLLSALPESERPRQIERLVSSPLEIWRRRAEERPHGFGHGYQFKTVRWPSLWYDALAVLTTVGDFPSIWAAGDVSDEDVTALAEIAACLIAYNLGSDGRVTPLRVHEGYELFSFGRKDAPSPFATAMLLAALVKVAPLAEKISRVDARALASSRAGGGTARPPEAATATVVCAVPEHTILQGPIRPAPTAHRGSISTRRGTTPARSRSPQTSPGSTPGRRRRPISRSPRGTRIWIPDVLDNALDERRIPRALALDARGPLRGPARLRLCGACGKRAAGCQGRPRLRAQEGRRYQDVRAARASG